ncbi:NADPH-dependent F420 reductase [Streptomyces sp. NPDC003077]|uniref:NADPH-dependent F420 reductase n=1 Tax=Streptomyces sp. NPDC003077 TaxID=3154443 RepID=UPI0033AE5391
MQISIIGTGNVGSVLARRCAELGHGVTTANSSTERAQVARDAGAADVVVLAVPYDAVAGLDAQIKAALAGKVVIDATNPLAADFLSLTVGHTTSGAERNAEALPGARLVKAFNMVLAANQNTGTLKGAALFLPVVGDDQDAKETVIELASRLGFDAVDAGPLSNARYTEPVAELLIQLAYGSGMGTGIGLGLLRG